MRWPWRRFEAMFKRHLLRQARIQLENQRDLNLAAINANSNFDSAENKDAKQSRIEAIEKGTKDAIEFIYADINKTKTATVEEDAFADDPLFRPVRRMREQIRDGAVPKQAGMGRDLLDGMV